MKPFDECFHLQISLHKNFFKSKKKYFKYLQIQQNIPDQQ